MTVNGNVEAGFEGVASAFERTLTQAGEMGAALAVYVDGEPVVDLWGGVADERTGAAWTRDTATVIFSTTKGLTSILAARLAQEGRLDLDDPVVAYWPEYGRHGKERTTVRDLLAHRSGLAAPRVDLWPSDLLDWDRVVDALADQEPLWAPGQGHAYHAITFGWLVGEVIRRVSGQSVGDYFRTAVAEPLDAAAWIGRPADQAGEVAHIRYRAHPDRVELAYDPEQSAADRYWEQRSGTLGAALPPELITPDGGFNDPRVHAAQLPGAGGIATARGLAAIWSATVVPTAGVRLLDDATVADVLRVQAEGRPVWGGTGPYGRWGTGFQLSAPPVRTYLGAGSFGHDGAGGQVGFADREHRVGFGYVTNLMTEFDDRRGLLLADEVRRALVGSGPS